MLTLRLVVWTLCLTFLIGSTPQLHAQSEPTEFHCANDDSCPEILIEGDPFAQINTSPAPFRGYGDPSLEFDGETLWLSYSWLQVLVQPSPDGPLIDFGVETHLARSDDMGQSFQFVRKINEASIVDPPGAENEAWTTDEVSTIVHQPDGTWQAMWLRYFDPFGEAERFGFHYWRSVAATPEELGNEAQAWVRGYATRVETSLDLSELSELNDCAVFTEPGLFSDGTDVYLATGCIVLEGGQRKPEDERLVLLRETDTGYDYVGVLLDYADAEHLNVDRLEQADIMFGHDGAILLIITPIIDDADPQHQGCIVYEISDIESGEVLRDSDGHAIPRAIITADGNGLGPGLCTYDPASETGILLIITTFDLQSQPPDIVFSLRATGVHP